MTALQPIQTVLAPEALSARTEYLGMPVGARVLDALRVAIEEGLLPSAALPQTAVYVNGERLPREAALDYVLVEGDVLNIVVEPLGGGGGGSKDIGRIVAQIAVIALAAVANMVPGIGPFLSAAVMTLGQLAINHLFKPEQDRARVDDRYALRGASNHYRPWDMMPLQLGESRFAPDFAAKTYTQNVGEDVWLHMILGVHYGPCEVTALKIGDTLVSSMGADEVQVAYHLTPGVRNWTIYPNTVEQGDHTDELNPNGTVVVRAGPDQGTKFEFDFAFPRGLWWDDEGDKKAEDVKVTVRMRQTTSTGTPIGGWVAAPFPIEQDAGGVNLPQGTVYFRAKSREPQRFTKALNAALGWYEFEFKRDAQEHGAGKTYDQTVLTAIRAIRFTPPIVDQTLSVIEMRVKATAMNQGSLAPITCVARPICEVWNNGAGTWGNAQATSNPAAVARWLYMGPAAAKPLLAAEVDASFGAWFQSCVTHTLVSGLRVAELRSQAEAMRLLEQAGRAWVYWNGVKLVAVPWMARPAPRQLFTGRNLRGHTGQLVYPEPVHALRVEFQNTDRDTRADEIIVYADGYDANTATKIEAFRIENPCSMSRAWRDGRWELARRQLQRRVDAWEADIEHIACSYGDRVRLRPWKIRTLLGTGRVRCRRFAGALVTGVRLDDPVEMQVGKTYGVDLRLGDQLITGVPVVTVPGVQRELTFVTPRAANVSPIRGDLVAFGETGFVSEDVEIVAIQPGDGHTARLVGVRYVADQLIAAEAGPIPPLTSVLTGGARPPTPVLVGVQPDPTGVRVMFAQPLYSAGVIDRYVCAWRGTPPVGATNGWVPLPNLPGNASTLVTPDPRAAPVAAGDVDQETRIDVSITAVAVDGQVSTALIVTNILVQSSVATGSAPTGFAALGLSRTAADGSAYGAIFVACDPRPGGEVLELATAYREWTGAAPTGDWVNGPRFPAANPIGDIAPAKAGQKYGVKAWWIGPGGWPSPETAEATTTVPAGSTTPPTDWTPDGVEPSDPYIDVNPVEPDVIVF